MAGREVFSARSGAGGSLPVYLCYDALSRPWMSYLCRTLLEKNLIAITIAIDLLIRINRTLIEVF
ncbi:MAG: hypothetical protein CW742_05820 [Methanoregula sp.]|nr:MAG: hypothetical protein CW742_05820 [Methanoregula sp.]